MTTVNGLPSHVLFVHFIVVLAPLTALLAILCAVWPVRNFSRWMSPVGVRRLSWRSPGWCSGLVG